MYENAVREKEGVIGKLALLEEGRRRLVDETTAAEQKHREDADVSVPSSHMYIMYIRGVVVHSRHNITQSDCILLSLVSLNTHKVPHSWAPPSSCDLQCHSHFLLCADLHCMKKDNRHLSFSYEWGVEQGEVQSPLAQLFFGWVGVCSLYMFRAI